MSDTIAEIQACIPALRRYARALQRNAPDADDLVQEALLKALEGLRSRRRDAEVRPWLFAILHNTFVSHRRKSNTRRPGMSLDMVGESAVSERGRQEDGLHWQDFVRAFGTIPEDQRMVLLLVSVEDMTYAEVARILDIPIGTVMSRLSRGRERLRGLTMADEGRTLLRRVK